MNSIQRLRRHYEALAAICKKQGCTMLTATQLCCPNRHPQVDIAVGGPIFIDHVDYIKKTE